MANKIKITATRSILVTSGLDYNDYSTDRNINVDAKWLKDAVMIHAGQHEYDAAIAKWPTVKALVAKGVLTIAATTAEVVEEAQPKTTKGTPKHKPELVVEKVEAVEETENVEIAETLKGE